MVPEKKKVLKFNIAEIDDRALWGFFSAQVNQSLNFIQCTFPQLCASFFLQYFQRKLLSLFCNYLSLSLSLSLAVALGEGNEV